MTSSAEPWWLPLIDDVSEEEEEEEKEKEQSKSASEAESAKSESESEPEKLFSEEVEANLKLAESRFNPMASNLTAYGLANENFRKVIYTTKHQQLVAMKLDYLGVPDEVHHESDQFVTVVQGSIRVHLNGQTERGFVLNEGDFVVVPAGTRHKIVSVMVDVDTGNLTYPKILTLYSPPQHSPGLVQKDNPDLKSVLAFREEQHKENEEEEETQEQLGIGGSMEETMHEFKHGKLHSGSKHGPVVRSRAQAIAIGLSQERRSRRKSGRRSEGRARSFAKK
jgi:mannose-6-phosphate isomerase-like protein (cupin superfamily)